MTITKTKAEALENYTDRVEKKSNFSLQDTIKTICILILCTLIGLLITHWGFNIENVIIVYIVGVQLNAIFTKGRLYSATSSILSVLIFNYFFTEPRYSLLVYDPNYPVTFLVMLTASFITSTLTMRIKDQAYQSARKAYRTEVLLETNKKLQQATHIEEILGETALQMVKLLDKTIVAYSLKGNHLSDPVVFVKNNFSGNSDMFKDEKERVAAEWVFKNSKQAGATTAIFPDSNCLYLAIRNNNSVFAVMGIVMTGEPVLDPFEKNLMLAMLGECALALEKKYLYEAQEQISNQIQQEKLRANLLRSISHDLRTPLTSISGNAGVLMKRSKTLKETQKQDLYTNIYDDSMWLISLVENLLSITRLDNSNLNLNMQPQLLIEVITEALLHINRNSIYHHIVSTIDNELLMSKMDSKLIIQVIINIVDNAIKYTPEGSHIMINVQEENQVIHVEVCDDGPGIDDQSKAKLFDMFYTADNLRGDGRRGLGLGLSLCKSIIHAHGGSIYVKDNFPRGTILGFTLQSTEVIINE